MYNEGSQQKLSHLRACCQEGDCAHLQSRDWQRPELRGQGGQEGELGGGREGEAQDHLDQGPVFRQKKHEKKTNKGESSRDRREVADLDSRE